MTLPTSIEYGCQMPEAKSTSRQGHSDTRDPQMTSSELADIIHTIKMPSLHGQEEDSSEDEYDATQEHSQTVHSTLLHSHTKPHGFDQVPPLPTPPVTVSPDPD